MVISPKECLTVGSGAGVALMTHQCGIGDDVHALPSVMSLLRDEDVTIYCRPFAVDFWRPSGAKIFSVEPSGLWNTAVCGDIREPLDLSWLSEHKESFARIFSLGNWSCWDTDEVGYSRKSMLDYIGEILGVEPLKDFSYLDYFGLNADREIDYDILFVPYSTERWRTIPASYAKELYDMMNAEYDVVRMLEPKECETFADFLTAIHSAGVVVSVENGVLNLAAAIGAPTVGLHGCTDPAHTVDALTIFGGVIPSFSVRGKSDECDLPCWRRPDKGLRNGRCCGKYDEARCMREIDPSKFMYALKQTIKRSTVLCQ